jgi:hypothetical protein
MDTATFLHCLAALDACDEVRVWIATQPDAATAWAACPRADWMMWLLGELHIRGALPSEMLVLAGCACAQTALWTVPAGDDRPRLALEEARRWAQGEAVRRWAQGEAARRWAQGEAMGWEVRAAAAGVAAATLAVADAAAAADAAARNAVADAIRGEVPWATVEAALNQTETM